MSDNTRKGPLDSRPALQGELIESLIAQIPGVGTKRWADAACAAFLDAEEVIGAEEDFRAAIYDLKQMPDAYVIHKDTMELHFFEVEVTHHMDLHKLEQYAKFLTDMDFYGISFGLFTVNQYGHINEVHLLPYYVSWLKGVREELGAKDE